MTFETAIAFYKTQAKIGRVLGLTRQRVSQFREMGLIPAEHALRLQTDSKGKVKVDPKVYEQHRALKAARV